MIERRFKWKITDGELVRECSGILLQFVFWELDRPPISGVMLKDDGKLEIVPYNELRYVSVA